MHSCLIKVQQKQKAICFVCDSFFSTIRKLLYIKDSYRLEMEATRDIPQESREFVKKVSKRKRSALTEMDQREDIRKNMRVTSKEDQEVIL
jgi:hypothetical protein